MVKFAGGNLKGRALDDGTTTPFGRTSRIGQGAGKASFTSVEGLRFVWRHRLSDVFASLGRGMDPGSAGAGDGAGGNLNTRRVGRWRYRAVREDVVMGQGD